MKNRDGEEVTDYYQRWFERSLRHSANTVHNRGLGNYTTAYNTWKRIESVRALLQEEIDKTKHELHILDAGCGDAIPLLIMASQNNTKSYNFFGIDASDLNITFAEGLRNSLKLNNVIFKKENIEKLPFQDSFFDIVICSEVLEHMEVPENSLREIKRVLKDTGTAIISTPNSDNPLIRLGRYFKRSDRHSETAFISTQHKEHDEDEIHDDHISTRGLKSWKKSFSAMGFSVETIKRHGMLYGGPAYNGHRFLFAFVMLLDTFLDHFSFGHIIAEGITYKLKKA